MDNCHHDNRGVFRNNLEIIKTLVECWKDHLNIPAEWGFVHKCAVSMLQHYCYELYQWSICQYAGYMWTYNEDTLNWSLLWAVAVTAAVVPIVLPRCIELLCEQWTFCSAHSSCHEHLAMQRCALAAGPFTVIFLTLKVTARGTGLGSSCWELSWPMGCLRTTQLQWEASLRRGGWARPSLWVGDTPVYSERLPYSRWWC